MSGDSGFPRRPGPVPRRPSSEYRNVLSDRSTPAKSTAQEALDVARYVADMTAQLEAMAIASRLEMLAYFLGMAKAESELMLRTSPGEPADEALDDAPDEEKSAEGSFD
jgi:hypothetical protein